MFSFPTFESAQAMATLKNVQYLDSLPQAIEDLNEEIAVEKEAVLADRENSTTVYCGWGTYIETLQSELQGYIDDMENNVELFHVEAQGNRFIVA